MTKTGIFYCLSAALLSAPAFAFNSGSTGADGAFNPTANIALQLPPDGIFNFTDVNIPAGVTVTFKKNAANTPVTILASGDITVAGTINVSAVAASGQTAGTGGSGGYDGGMGGPLLSPGGPGKGPGGGNSGKGTSFYGHPCAGGGGGYGSQGGTANPNTCSTSGGATYGSAVLVPMIGGSGGGGGAGTSSRVGFGGGGGGGALLLAAAGTINIIGAIYADGSSARPNTSDISPGNSGGGSGGAIRLIATTIAGNGTINANGGENSGSNGGFGGAGRIRLETETPLQRTVQSSPSFSLSAPYSVFAALPTLRFVSIAGVLAPAQPSGDSDVSLPADIGNPVTVELASSDVPLGSTIKLLSTPEIGVQVTANSSPIAGSESDGTASAQITIADGKSTLIATVGFTVTAALGEELAPYAGGEKVARVELTAGLQGAATTKLITASGKEYLLPPSAQAVLAQ